jgi:probable blue pigment (indigoidine) exporter
MIARYRNAILFGLAAVLIGGVYVATKIGLSYLPPVFFAALRFECAAVPLLLYVRLTSTQWRPYTRDDWYTILASGGLVVAAANIFLFIGQQFTTSATAAVIASLSPILAVGFAFILLSETAITRRRILGIGCGLIGAAIIAHPDVERLVAPVVVGKGLIFLAAAALALGSVLMRRYETSLSTIAVTGWAMLLGGSAILLLSLLLGEPIGHVRWTPIAILVVVYNGLLATPVAYVAYFELVETIGPIQTTLITYVAPVVTALAEWVLLGEILSVETTIGFGVIVVGFVLVRYRTLLEEAKRLRGHLTTSAE